MAEDNVSSMIEDNRLTKKVFRRCFRQSRDVSREYFLTLTTHDSRLLMPHQKHSIAEKQFAVFPEAAE